MIRPRPSLSARARTRAHAGAARFRGRARRNPGTRYRGRRPLGGHPAYLRNTNILSDLIRHGRIGRVAAVLEQRDAAVATSIVVAAEIRYGVARKRSEALAERAEVVLQSITILPCGTPADRHYGEIRAVLERAGTPIGPNDLIIASRCGHSA